MPYCKMYRVGPVELDTLSQLWGFSVYGADGKWRTWESFDWLEDAEAQRTRYLENGAREMTLPMGSL